MLGIPVEIYYCKLVNCLNSILDFWIFVSFLDSTVYLYFGM